MDASYRAGGLEGPVHHNVFTGSTPFRRCPRTAAGVVHGGSNITLLGSMGLRRLGAALVVAAVVVAAVVQGGHAQAPPRGAAAAGPAATEASPPRSEPSRVVPPDEFGRATPRGTINGFLSATDARNYG